MNAITNITIGQTGRLKKPMRLWNCACTPPEMRLIAVRNATYRSLNCDRSYF